MYPSPIPSLNHVLVPVFVFGWANDGQGFVLPDVVLPANLCSPSWSVVSIFRIYFCRCFKYKYFETSATFDFKLLKVKYELWWKLDQLDRYPIDTKKEKTLKTSFPPENLDLASSKKDGEAGTCQKAQNKFQGSLNKFRLYHGGEISIVELHQANWSSLRSKSRTVLVVARLLGLWTIALWVEGHTRLVVNKLKTQDWKIYLNIQ